MTQKKEMIMLKIIKIKKYQLNRNTSWQIFKTLCYYQVVLSQDI